jgi:hypothetical protein
MGSLSKTIEVYKAEKYDWTRVKAVLVVIMASLTQVAAMSDSLPEWMNTSLKAAIPFVAVLIGLAGAAAAWNAKPILVPEDPQPEA